MKPLNHNHIVLMLVLIGLLFFRPFSGGHLANWIFLAATILSAWVVSFDRPRTRRVLLIIALSFATVLLVVPFFPIKEYGLPNGLPTVLAACAILISLLYCCFVLCRALLLADEVSGNEIAGSLSLYLLLGFVWSYAYVLLELFRPDSFDLGLVGRPVGSRLVYFSFVTLTTLGYGDITPLTPFARMLTILEAISGQLYVAVVVSYLLSIHIDQRLKAK
jgi:voltage-gated potassium channel